MDIDNENELQDITDYVNNVRENGVFVPVETSACTSNSNDQFVRYNMAYLVVDTNFLLSQLNLLDELEQLAHHKYQGSYQIVIPKQVIHELDGLKDTPHNAVSSQHSISSMARKSIDWCFAHLHDSVPTVTGQRINERIDQDATKDNSILDCCLYFKNVEGAGGNLVILLSNDKNLCNKALINNILTVSFRPGMTAELIASNVVLETRNLYGSYSNDSRQHNSNPPEHVDVRQHALLNADIPMEEDLGFLTETTGNHKFAVENLYYETSHKIYEEVTQLVLEAIDWAVNEIFGDDVGLSGYNPSKMQTLLDAKRCIIRMEISTFADFFNRRFFDPMKVLKEDTNKLYSSVPSNIHDLDKFVEFWTGFLNGIYKDRDEVQQSAFKRISKHWDKMVNYIK